MTLLVVRIFLITAIFSSPVFGLTIDQDRLIDEVIRGAFVTRNNVTGMSLAIVDNGKTVLAKGFGMQDIENRIEATNNTLFAIGSISKSFVATLVVKILSEKFPNEGESVLDRPIISFKPKYNFTLSDRYRTEQVTFRDILSHRTCLVSHDFDFLFGTVSLEEYNYRTRYQKEKCGHRAKFVYNNALYALAGEVIASFVGKSFEKLVKEFMLEIGMTSSTVIDKSGSYEGLPNMSQAYYYKDGTVHKMNRSLIKRVSIATGAGAILSTSTDMGKYMEFHSNKGKVGNKQIVSEMAMSWLWKASILTLEIPSKPDINGPIHSYYAYGLGFGLSLYDGYASFGHSGGWPPFYSDIRFYEYDGKITGVFMTINGAEWFDTPKGLSEEAVSGVIFDIMRTGTYNRNLTRATEQRSEGNVTSDTNKEILQTTEMKTENSSNNSSTKNFNDLIGLYGNDSAGDLIVKLDTEDATFLQFNFGEWGIGRLLQMNGSNTKYLVKWKTDIVQFFTASSSVLPDPIFHIDFKPSRGTLDLSMNNELIFIFLKNATLNTFPVIPWDKISCGPL